MLTAALLSAVIAQAPEPTPLRHELRLLPQAQLNTKYTEQYGGALIYALRLREGVALRASVYRTWVAADGAFLHDLLRVRQTIRPVTRVHAAWTAHAGVELTVARGEVWRATPVSVSTDVGLGAFNTAFLLPTGTGTRAADVGTRFSATMGVTASLRLSKHLALVAELRHTFAPAYIETVDGCTADDLLAMEGALRAQRPHAASVSSGCRAAAFTSHTEVLAASSLVRGNTPWQGDFANDIASIVSGGVGLALSF